MDADEIRAHFELLGRVPRVQREPLYSCRYCGASVPARFIELHMGTFLHPWAGRGGFFNQSVSYSVFVGASVQDEVLNYLRAGFNVHLSFKGLGAN